jgi:hypothetical protein
MNQFWSTYSTIPLYLFEFLWVFLLLFLDHIVVIVQVSNNSWGWVVWAWSMAVGSCARGAATWWQLHGRSFHELINTMDNQCSACVTNVTIKTTCYWMTYWMLLNSHWLGYSYDFINHNAAELSLIRIQYWLQYFCLGSVWQNAHWLGYSFDSSIFV